jgi:ketosteroid isomerase-like protein
MMTLTVSQFRDESADREAIRDCIWRYCRGVDRADEAMLRSAYWPDAIDEHAGLYSGPAKDFIDQSVTNLHTLGDTMHYVTNMLIRIEGDTAKAESYYYAIHRLENDGPVRDVIGCGRYLDRFEKRADEWRIAHRVVAIDWFRDYGDSGDWAVGPFGLGDASRGKRGPQDLSSSWLDLK